MPTLLTEIKGLVVQAANSGALSPDEIEANQLQVDSAVQSITRISNTTTFAGLHLIDGGLDYITSGVETSAISSLHISQANFGTNTTIPVQVNVLTSARQADLQFRQLRSPARSRCRSPGTRGRKTLTFTSGTTASAIAFAVNGVSDSTGVTAKLINPANAASGVEFLSTGYGSQAIRLGAGPDRARSTRPTSAATPVKRVDRPRRRRHRQRRGHHRRRPEPQGQHRRRWTWT